MRVAVIADIHLNITYNSDCGYPLCLDRGTYKTDASVGSVANMLEDMLDQYQGKQLDAILITGDFVIHDKAIENVTMPHKWGTEILPILSKAYNMVKEKFPNTLLIPCFGNNDAPYHYQTIK